MDLQPDILFHIGPLALTRTVATSWTITLVLALVAAAATRRLRVLDPGKVQTALEGAVLAMHDAIGGVVPDQGARLLPLVGTLWLFIAVANLAGIIPGVHSPTGDLSTTAALALIVFVAVHWFGIRSEGLHAYLRHYLAPSPLLLPFHLISEVTRTVALAMRLFGNIMSLELAALLILLVAGFLVPVPLLMLHVVEALVQSYIFGMLALVYIGSAMQARKAGLGAQTGEHRA